MKCPRLLQFRPVEKSMESNYFGDCLKEECAWWNSEVKACSEVVKCLELATISETLGGIEHKMPHEGQFRK